jgi:uncharacterized protein YodC (DUF2158 family)
MDSFVKGNTVQLKSGGQEMTVSDINENGIKCCWFRNTEIKFETFPSEALQIFEKNPPDTAITSSGSDSERLQNMILHDIERHGFLLERDISLSLQDAGYQVQSGVAFIDPVESKQREGDITASLNGRAKKVHWLTFELIIECQWSSYPVTVFPRDFSITTSTSHIFPMAYPEVKINLSNLKVSSEESSLLRQHKQIVNSSLASLIQASTPQVVATNVTKGDRQSRERTDWTWIKDDILKVFDRSLIRTKEVQEYNQLLFDSKQGYCAHVIVPTIIVGGEMFQANRDGTLNECQCCTLHRWFVIPESLRNPTSPWETLKEVYINIVHKSYFDEYNSKVKALFVQSITGLDKSDMFSWLL